jgi:NADPH:quinone reductase-like Zn-dependent oxidoreductase
MTSQGSSIPNAVPDLMRGVVLTGHGGLDKLELRDDLPVPALGPDDVLIEVAACGMNNTDINTRLGWYSKEVTGATEEEAVAEAGSWGGGLECPRIQGADPVGRIVAVGDEVVPVRVGERVLVDAWLRDPEGILERARYLGSEVDGGYAEYVKVPASNAHAVNCTLTDVELAGFPCSYSTAERMLHRAGVHQGQWVLVTGASGGVGGALIQLARRRGAQVVAVSSGGKLEAVGDLGAQVVLDRSRSDLARAIVEATGGVDVFADVVGGPQFAPLLETIRRGGHYTVAGAIAGPIVPLDLRTLYLHDLTMHGATALPPGVFANLVSYIERGEVRPVVAATYPLTAIKEAQEAFVRKDHVGAIVIEVAS